MVFHVVQLAKVQDMPEAGSCVGESKLRSVFVRHVLDEPEPPVTENNQTQSGRIAHNRQIRI